jgi:hypothetical protein
LENERKAPENRSVSPKKRILSPLVINRTELRSIAPDDSALKYDEEKFLIYSVFRQKILDSTLKSLAKEMIKETVQEFKANPNIGRKKLKSMVSGQKVNQELDSKLKYNSNNLKIMKLRYLVNKDYDVHK